jgi:hypothetical protein
MAAPPKTEKDFARGRQWGVTWRHFHFALFYRSTLDAGEGVNVHLPRENHDIYTSCTAQ